MRRRGFGQTRAVSPQTNCVGPRTFIVAAGAKRLAGCRRANASNTGARDMGCAGIVFAGRRSCLGISWRLFIRDLCCSLCCYGVSSTPMGLGPVEFECIKTGEPSARTEGKLHANVISSSVGRFYSRVNCPLCDDAWAIFRQAGFAERLLRLDIDSRELWVQRYGWRIPVLQLLDGTEFDVALEDEMNAALGALQLTSRALDPL